MNTKWIALALLLQSWGAVAQTNCSVQLQDLSKEFETLRVEADVPGMAIGAAIYGEPVYEEGFGFANKLRRTPVTPSTIFQIASVTKPITALAVMEIAEKHAVDLESTVDLGPGSHLVSPHHPSKEITLIQLLTHTSSIQDGMYYEVDFRTPGQDSEMELSELLEGILLENGKYYSANKSFLKSAPGEQWSYSNIGYNLLGHWAEQQSELNFKDWTKNNFFELLEMDHTFWTIADTHGLEVATPYQALSDGQLVAVAQSSTPGYPAAMLRSTISDMTKFFGAVANSGVFMGKAISSDRVLQEVFSERSIRGIPDHLENQFVAWNSYNYKGRSYLSHFGGNIGVFTAAYVAPETGLALVILTNRNAERPQINMFQEISRKVYDAVEKCNIKDARAS
ncbi:serine hydrolase domain-containing protein [Microbulbifer sp. ZKSA004]|uniref:serine hydrolase domain-containing protein n=1 Tax=Microbulbifer sp. ZKSA004 TaxID=3243389 RepID=UPI00403A4A36